ncbi:DUF4010 domain-containing protein [Noviherbaspirillum agri]
MLSFAVALGGGMLIGIERERNKGTGPSRALGGVRTFTLTGAGGAFTQVIGQPWLVALGAALVAILIAVSYWRQRSDDPGVTTEIALFITYVLGVGAIDHAQLVSAAFVAVAVLLASKTRLHRFATQVLTESEMRDGLILASAALIVAPLIPNQEVRYLANANPSHLWRLVVLLMALQAVGYIALRAAGARVGLVVAGLASGIVSSTTAMGAMGARARNQPELVSSYAAGAVCSNISSMALLLPVAATIYPPILKEIWPALLAGMGTGLAIAILLARQRINHDNVEPHTQKVFSIGQAVGFAAVLTALTGAITLATERYGMAAAEIGAALAATVEMQAAVGSLFSLAAGGRLEASGIMLPLLFALSTNMACKALIAFAVGGVGFGVRTSIGLFCTIAAMWVTLLI